MMVGPSGSSRFSVVIEPEGMEYALPPHERVLLTFVIPDTAVQYFDIAHGSDSLTIWRPADTQVWATLADGTREQIGGFEGVPAPWLDSASPLPRSEAPWTWPPKDEDGPPAR